MVGLDGPRRLFQHKQFHDFLQHASAKCWASLTLDPPREMYLVTGHRGSAHDAGPVSPGASALVPMLSAPRL